MRKIIAFLLFFTLSLKNTNAHEGTFKEKLSPYDVFFGKEDVYQVCYPKSHRLYFNVIIVLSLSTISLLLALNFLRRKNNQKLAAKNRIIENQNKELIDSIVYAQRIQNALLPELTKSSDENINVLYLPKNIVSGDFYWMYQKNELKFYAVIDCTGHGVPGAFLSMLAHTGLNYAIANSISNLPADILDEMNTFVKQALKQQNNHSIQDGMEVGVCVYNSKTYKLNYAGASINLLYFQNKKLNIIKASKCTVGSFQPHVLSRPENHCLTMQKGDRIFMHSDGVIDQFGAKSNKKLTSKKFKEMLEYSIGFNFEKQFKFIEEEITIWKGDMEQTDDILFMCVEL